MPALKRDDNKIVAFVKKKQAQGLETTPTHLIDYIKNTFDIKRQTSCSLIISNLVKRGRLQRTSRKGIISIGENI